MELLWQLSFSFYSGFNLIYIPGMSYGIFERLQGFATTSIGLFLLLFYHFSLPPFSNKKTAGLIGAFGILLLTSLVFPVSINSKLQVLHTLFLTIVILYVLLIQILAIRARVTGAVYLICASLALLVYFESLW